MNRKLLIATSISTIIICAFSSHSLANKDDEISKKQVVSSNDYKSVIATLSSQKDLSTNYVFKDMYYVFRHPGGLTTNHICVQLEDCRNSHQELSVVFSRSNEHWNADYFYRFYDHICLMGNVTYDVAEIIARAIKKSEIYGSGHRIVSIIGSDSGHFKTSATPPKGTDFVVELMSSNGFNGQYNNRRVFTSVKKGIVSFIGKEDSFVMH
jgi:hypothetical protein